MTKHVCKKLLTCKCGKYTACELCLLWDGGEEPSCPLCFENKHLTPPNPIAQAEFLNYVFGRNQILL